MQFTRYDIPVKVGSVRSLVWRGDDLIDWAAGGITYRLDGTQERGRYSYAYKFDAAVAAPSGNYAFVYQRLGTKGLLLDRSAQIVREIDRSFYHAHAYEFPVVLFALPDGREVMAHCPLGYNQLHIDLLETGERLTPRAATEARPADVFHSRLAVNPSRTRLLSAGWVWHPVDVAAVYDVRDGLSDPASLDRMSSAAPADSDLSVASFAADDLLVVASAKDATPFEVEADEPLLLPGMMGVYDLAARRYQSLVRAEEEAGTMMPIGDRHAIGFHEHPKLFDLSTGKVIHRWSDLQTSKQFSSIIWGLDSLPALAMDARNRRFAVAHGDAIVVIVLPPTVAGG